MQRPITLPLRRVTQASTPSQLVPARRFAISSRPPARLYHCISPLNRRPAQSRAQHLVRRNGPQIQSIRHATVYTAKGTTLRERVRELQKDSPILFPLSLVCIFIAFLCAVYTTWYYINAIYPIDANFPAPVATKLKRALYYTYQDLQPQKAWDYYAQALRICDELEISPFSAQVLGIRLQVVDLLHRTNHLKEAVQLLEKIKSDCLQFVEFCDARDNPELWPHRTRVLEKVVQSSVKLGEYYSDNVYTRNDELAERNFVEALEILLGEVRRREKENLSDEEWGAWMSLEEIGGSLEALADFYEKQNKHYLAAPLYLRAVTMAQPPNCHTAVLMNNLAASLAQTSPEKPPASSDTRSDPPTSRPALISNARQWTEKSIAVCQSLKPPTRTEECDAACATATHNLGEFAEMEGLVDEARKRYAEARSLARAIGSQEGIEHANEALKRIGDKP